MAGRGSSQSAFIPGIRRRTGPGQSAAALYLANNPGLSPAQVKAALVAAGNYGWDHSDDPDGSQEPLLDVGSF